MKQISEMGVNRKFYFRWNWKFYWELSNVILGENWLFKRAVFPSGTLYPSTNYVIFKMVYWLDAQILAPISLH